MYRVLAPVLFAILVVIGLIGSSPVDTSALTGSPTPEPSQMPDGLCEPGSPADWEFADVRPSGPLDAAVVPAAELATSEPEPVRELYLVVITLPPGHCMPYSSPGNQKDAIVMIVQQGAVEYLWEAIPGTTPTVKRGSSAGSQGLSPEGTPQPLYPGDWVTQDQEVRFSYRNVGGDSAVILKAVWTDPEGGGCSGGCR
jgi:hypothetical protein